MSNPWLSGFVADEIGAISRQEISGRRRRFRLVSLCFEGFHGGEAFRSNVAKMRSRTRICARGARFSPCARQPIRWAMHLTLFG